MLSGGGTEGSKLQIVEGETPGRKTQQEESGAQGVSLKYTTPGNGSHSTGKKSTSVIHYTYIAEISYDLNIN